MASQLKKLSLFTAGLAFTFGLSAQSPDERSDSERSDDLSDYFSDHKNDTSYYTYGTSHQREIRYGGRSSTKGYEKGQKGYYLVLFGEHLLSIPAGLDSAYAVSLEEKFLRSGFVDFEQAFNFEEGEFIYQIPCPAPSVSDVKYTKNRNGAELWIQDPSDNRLTVRGIFDKEALIQFFRNIKNQGKDFNLKYIDFGKLFEASELNYVQAFGDQGFFNSEPVIKMEGNVDTHDLPGRLHSLFEDHRLPSAPKNEP